MHNLQTIFGKNQHAIGKKKNWAKNAPFASIFQKVSQGNSDPLPSSKHKKLPVLALYAPMQLKSTFSGITYNGALTAKNKYNG